MFQNKIGKTATKLVNLTNETIHVYEKSSGKIVTLEPSQKQLPETPQNDLDKTMYIVNQEVARKLIDSANRSVSDLAIVYRQNNGRHNIKITYFVWAEDLKTDVILLSHPKDI